MRQTFSQARRSNILIVAVGAIALAIFFVVALWKADLAKAAYTGSGWSDGYHAVANPSDPYDWWFPHIGHSANSTSYYQSPDLNVIKHEETLNFDDYWTSQGAPFVNNWPFGLVFQNPINEYKAQSSNTWASVTTGYYLDTCIYDYQDVQACWANTSVTVVGQNLSILDARGKSTMLLDTSIYRWATTGTVAKTFTTPQYTAY